jgi:hypothetical protein
VLKRHLGAIKVGWQSGVRLGIDICNESDPCILVAWVSIGTKRGVKAYALVIPQLAEEGEKLTLPAANLDNLLVPQVVTID